MALDAGSLTVDDDGNVTGSGLSLAIFNGACSALDDDIKATIAEGMAPFCEGLATAIVDHIRDNAEVTVTIQTTDTGLQRLPAILTPGSDTDGPTLAKALTGTLV